MALFGKRKNSKEENHVVNDAEVKVGEFAAFALLSGADWDKDQFFADLNEEWGIGIDDDHPEDSDVVYVEAEGFRVIVALMPMPVPNGEAEHYAKANYMWKDAEKIVSRHKAHLIVTVLGEGDMLKRANVFVKICSSLMNQKNAVALYSEGAVYSPQMFRDFSGVLKDGDLEGEVPILNLVWFGIYGDGKNAGVYTYGMRRLGKEEIEVYVPQRSADLNQMRSFLVSVAAYVIGEDVILRDGETIGFSATEKLPIKLSPGVAVDGNTLKIDITKQ